MRRDKFEIINDILSIAETPVGKTAILYGANLNSRRVNNYLELLVEKDFIKKNDGPPFKYVVTDKGRDFLKHYRELKKEFDS